MFIAGYTKAITSYCAEVGEIRMGVVVSRGTFEGTMKRMSCEWESYDYRTSLGRVELYKRLGDTAEGQHEIKS